MMMMEDGGRGCWRMVEDFNMMKDCSGVCQRKKCNAIFIPACEFLWPLRVCVTTITYYILRCGNIGFVYVLCRWRIDVTKNNLSGGLYIY